MDRAPEPPAVPTSQRLAVALGERYRLELLLGQGGMGAVYRAHDRLTDQRVALKLVPVGQDAGGTSSSAPLLGSEETVPFSLEGLAGEGERATRLAAGQPDPGQRKTRALPEKQLEPTPRVYVAAPTSQSSMDPVWARMALAQEFRTLASLRHPHIISVLDYGFVAHTQPFFTMELLENARSLMAATKTLPRTEKALLLAQLLRALSYLHRHGILHQDLKPANVMVLSGREGLSVKLLDFGLALARSQVQGRAGVIAGTLSYMAPELLEGGSASEATDLFAVGVIAYQLFTRRHPFERRDDDQVVAAILKQEPDWEPLVPYPALLALLRQLLAKSPAARPAADEALHALCAAVGIPLPQETVALRESTLQAARFVGREEPMASLRRALDAARDGSGQVWLLAGESGVGKSRLMEELRIYSLVQGVVSARGQAVSEGGEAYGSWREILRTLCLGTQLPELEASVLKSLVPDLENLLERAIPDAPALSPQAAQLRLINAMEFLLLRQSEPLLLLLEDLQWADAESLALLRRLSQSCRRHPILIVASFRDDERPELPRLLPECQALKLARLSTGSIMALCRSMLGEQGCTPELVAFLEAESEGNVLFVIEVMRALAEEAGQLSLVATHRLPAHILTGGIQAMVQRRIGRLPAEARPLLNLAAVAGRQLDLAVLRVFEPNIEPWLYLAADSAVLEVSGAAWRFAHDKIRESLLLELDPEERQRLHLALAQALARIYPGSPSHAAAQAEHYQRGGDQAKAAFYLVEAGAHALSQGATEQAAALLGQALGPESRPLLSRVQVARANNGMVQATMALGKVALCTAAYEQLVAQVGLSMPDDLASMAAAGSLTVARRIGAMPSLTQTQSEEERRICSQVSQASRWACEAYVLRGQPIKSMAAALCGSELARLLGDKGRQSYFLAMFSYVAGLIPLHGLSRRLLEQGSRLLQDVPDLHAELDFRRVAGTRHLNAAEWKPAESQFDALIARARQAGDEYSLIFGLALRCIVAFRQEDERSYEALSAELHIRAKRNQSSHFSRIYPIYQGITLLRRGDVDGAWPLLVEAEGYVQQTQDRVGQILVGGAVAHCIFCQGKTEEALLRASATLALVETARFSMDTVGEGISGIIAVYLGAWEAADAAERRRLADPLRRSLAVMRGCALVFPAFAPRALLWHGRYAWSCGAVRMARRLGEASQRDARRLGMPYDEALADEWLARFAEPPPAAAGEPSGELRGLLQMLARRFL